MKVLAPAPSRSITPLANPPTFAVAIAAFQAAATLGAAIRSALDQTYPAHEVIVVDDGSTDRTAEVAQSFGGRVTLVRKANGGGASAKNAAAEVASADFLAILDADDVYDARRLEALAGLAMSRPDLDLVTSDAAFVIAGTAVGRFSQVTPFAVTDQRSAILENCFVGGWPAVRLARLQAIGGFDEALRIGYDWDCWLRLIFAGSTAGMVDEPYYEYRLHDAAVSADRVASLWERVRLLEKAPRTATLSRGERSTLRRSLRVQRSKAVRAETLVTLARPGAGRLPRLVAMRGVEVRARAGALLAIVAPRLARALIREQPAPAQRLGRPPE